MWCCDYQLDVRSGHLDIGIGQNLAGDAAMSKVAVISTEELRPDKESGSVLNVRNPFSHVGIAYWPRTGRLVGIDKYTRHV
jgi:hypothetical protein